MLIFIAEMDLDLEYPDDDLDAMLDQELDVMNEMEKEMHGFVVERQYYGSP